MEKRSNESVLSMIDNLLEQADHVKQAAANLDLASDAKSKHPSADVSDGTRPATEGARSAENKSDVSKQVPLNVEEAASKNEAGGSENAADTMGTQSMDADAMKGNVETAKKESPPIAGEGPGTGDIKMEYGTKVSADELVSGANSLLKQLSTALNVKTAVDVAPEGEVAPVATPVEGEAQPEAPKVEGAEGEKPASDVAGMYKAAAKAYPEDEEAGYVAASMLIDFLGEEKSASDKYEQTVDGIRKQASTDAESYTSFLKGYEESVKQAQGMPPGLEGMMAGGPEAGMGGPGAGMGDPAAAMGAPAGGEGGGGEEAALAALAGAAGGEGGMGGEGGEEGGGGPDDEAIIEAIAEALDEAGVTPEELAEAVAEAQGGAPMGGEEGMPPEGAPEEALAPVGGGEEMAPEPKLASGQKGQVKKAASKGALRAAVQRIVRGK